MEPTVDVAQFEAEFYVRNIYLSEAPPGYSKAEAIDAHEGACDAARDYNDYWRIREALGSLTQATAPQAETLTSETLLCNGWTALASPAVGEAFGSVVRAARIKLLQRRAERLKGRLAL